MSRAGDYFDVVLKEAHLNWGTKTRSNNARKRNEFEVYIPINIVNAKTYDIKTGEEFDCFSDDGYFEGPLKATGSQGDAYQYGKNLHKSGDLRALGYWLKNRRRVKAGDTIRLEFIDEHTLKLSLL